MPPDLLIFGASTRAAAFSALRAGLQPWCADLFADADLCARCPALRVPPEHYPNDFANLVDTEVPGAWMYTGGLENRGDLISRMALRRPLWGISRPQLEWARSPEFVHKTLTEAGLLCPQCLPSEGPALREGRWLTKARQGAGGAGIRFWDGKPLRRPLAERLYFQEFIEGEASAAVYLGLENGSRLLGVTRQLVGIPWLHAAPFHYCGSIGPLPLGCVSRQTFDRLGQALTASCQLRGLFGVDCILRDGIPWPVEINPRYTASVEVLELTKHLHTLALHRLAFDAGAPEPSLVEESSGTHVLGKAILFAKAPLVFPADGPWRSMLQQRGPLDQPPAFADVPNAAEPIEAGRPILTFFTRAASLAGCVDDLQQIAADLDRWLFGR